MIFLVMGTLKREFKFHSFTNNALRGKELMGCCLLHHPKTRSCSPHLTEPKNPKQRIRL